MSSNFKLYDVTLRCGLKDGQRLNYNFNHDPFISEIEDTIKTLLSAFEGITVITIFSGDIECGYFSLNFENPLTKS